MSEQKLRVLVVEPGKTPAVRAIDRSLESMQRLVGGYIQAVYPFDDPLALICNEEGKLLGLPMNRTLRDERGVPYDIVCSTFFLAGIAEDDFASLTDRQIEKYTDYYRREAVLSVPMGPKTQKKEKHEHER